MELNGTVFVFSVSRARGAVAAYATARGHRTDGLARGYDGTVRGLKSFPREDWPRVAIVFWSFRIMVGLGFLMVATGLVSVNPYP